MIKKILTKAEKDKINKRKQLILGIVLIFLLVISTAGFSWLSRDSKDEERVVIEKGLEFYDQNGIWMTQIGGQVFAFSYLPSEVEEIAVEGYYNLGDYSNVPLYFNNVEDGAVEILSNLNSYILRYQIACVDESCEEDVPIKDCTDNFIIFKEGENSVYKDENCVYIVGEQKKGANAFLYKVLNIY